MLGGAQLLFHKEQARYQHPWKTLKHLHDLGRLADVDLAFALHLLKEPTSESEGLAAFLCHMMHSAREGHLCIELKEVNRLEPNPLDSWLAPLSPKEVEQIEGSIDGQALYRALLSASAQLPAHWVCVKEPRDFSMQALSLRPFYRVGSLLYLQKSWVYETLFITHWERLCLQKPEKALASAYLEESLSRGLESQALLPEQAQAIRRASQQSLSVISGGPGTGKTYTAGYLIRLLMEACSEKDSLEIALAAPTGKAAAALQASIYRALGQRGSQVDLKTMTLHRLLGSSSFHHDLRRSQFLTADLLLIDESSMIDAKLMALLFSGVKNGARLILLGDKNQLPPVEMGGLFRDLTELEEAKKLTTHLKRCMRAENSDLQNLAQAVNEGNIEGVLGCFNGESPVVCGSHRLDELKTSEFLERTKHFFPHPHVLEDRAIMQAFQHFRILSPTRKGLFGVEALNALFCRSYSLQRSQESWVTYPIMITKNDSRLELCNGDVGVLVRKSRGFSSQSWEKTALQEGDYALFGSPEAPQKVPAVLLPPFEFAFCLSIHKSQGSEFDHILLLTPGGAEVFGRELLYTAVTRARKKIDVLYDETALCAALSRVCSRRSGLAERVCGA